MAAILQASLVANKPVLQGHSVTPCAAERRYRPSVSSASSRLPLDAVAGRACMVAGTLLFGAAVRKSFSELQTARKRCRFATKRRSSGQLWRHAIASWNPVELASREPSMPAAARIVVTALTGSHDAFVLRITPVFSPAVAAALLQLLDNGAFADVEWSERVVPGMISLGTSIGRNSLDDPGVLLGGKTCREVYQGSVCLCFQADKDQLYFCLVCEDGPVPSHWRVLPIGSVADPDSLLTFLQTAGSLAQPRAARPRSGCRREEPLDLASRVSPSIAQEPLSDDAAVVHYFPFDLMDPITNPKWNPRGWLMCFQPEILPALKEIMGYTCSPPFPWGHHFYSQLFLKRCAHLDGDLVELGVAAGGTSVFLARLAQSAGKRLICADSFEGLPSPRKSVDNPHFQEGDFGPEDPSRDLCKEFQHYAGSQGVLPSMTIIKSLFSDIESLPCERICFAHLDSDLYDSIESSLNLVYDRLVPGGILIIDDFFHHAQGPARAASEFFREVEGPPPLLHPIPPCAVAIQKGLTADVSSPRCILDGNFYSFEWLRGSDAFLACAEASRARLLSEVKAQPVANAGPRAASLRRCLHNADRFVAFLRGTPTGGSEVLEYFSCLGLWTDACQVRDAAKF
eukprot:TRINITY_DN123127_c0_g1_i1.p1 TRINITY_DN123127_c0_g1~~TRINITY_DN123127_c0_g1_i1.p1  ORF type:complete len:645 (-),score=54.12 TRINITY_DN123127_c0_g1_i1:42-1922(-)